MIHVDCILNKRGFWFGVYYFDEEHRTITDRQRKVWTSSNGWKIIIGLNMPPSVNVESKAIFIYGCDDRYDNLSTFCEVKSELGAALICREIKNVIEEFNKSDQKFESSMAR
jgi:hypothetical protein